MAQHTHSTPRKDFAEAAKSAEATKFFYKVIRVQISQKGEW